MLIGVRPLTLCLSLRVHSTAPFPGTPSPKQNLVVYTKVWTHHESANHKSGEQTASKFSHAFKFIMGYPQALCGELSSPRPAQNASLICRLPGCPLTLYDCNTSHRASLRADHAASNPLCSFLPVWVRHLLDQSLTKQ